jgi:tRNA-2-methylthio-N6-dimethylallyladenosine synthase
MRKEDQFLLMQNLMENLLHYKMTLKKIFIKTFGCQMNEYDSNRIYDSVKKIGYKKTENYEDANCYLLNTCHIRDKAKEKVYHEIGRVKKIFRSKKKPLVIIAGCVAQAENQEMLKREPYIDLVIGPQAYHKINDIILNYKEKKKKLEETEFDAISKFKYFNKIKNDSGKISSFLTIQEGCDKFCHFCVVPYTRGPEYSRPFKQILDEVKYLADTGTQEIILLGQNVNAYNNEKYRLSNLILEIEKFSEIKRIRYTTSHPKDMSDDLIEVYKNSKKLMPLVHLPVQSGSNKVLNLMNRKHTISDYYKIFDRLKEINPDIQFSSDFIIGYPGEEDEDFKATFELIKKIKFINSYSFIFSPRPGTVAADLKLIDRKISMERLEKIQSQLYDNQMHMNKSLEHKTINVLVENLTEDKTGVFGRSEYMTSVIFDGKKEDIGKIVPVKINKSNRSTLFGKKDFNYNQKVA